MVFLQVLSEHVVLFFHCNPISRSFTLLTHHSQDSNSPQPYSSHYHSFFPFRSLIQRFSLPKNLASTDPPRKIPPETSNIRSSARNKSRAHSARGGSPSIRSRFACISEFQHLDSRRCAWRGNFLPFYEDTFGGGGDTAMGGLGDPSYASRVPSRSMIRWPGLGDSPSHGSCFVHCSLILDWSGLDEFSSLGSCPGLCSLILDGPLFPTGAGAFPSLCCAYRNRACATLQVVTILDPLQIR